MDIFVFALNTIGTIAFAASGALLAIEKKMDLLGVVILGLTTAVGGGFIRDITLGHLPPQMFLSPIWASIAIIVSVIIFLPHVRALINKSEKKYNFFMFIMDSIGLAAFTATGVTTSMQHGHTGISLILFVGVITGCGGGVLRDIFAGETPYIFKKHIYACASAVGALVTYMLYNICGDALAGISGFCIIIIVRCLSARYKWNLPTAK